MWRMYKDNKKKSSWSQMEQLPFWDITITITIEPYTVVLPTKTQKFESKFLFKIKNTLNKIIYFINPRILL